MVSTIKISEFDDVDLTDPDNKLGGIGGGLNRKSSKVVTWTTLTRPASPFDGLLGYNTDVKLYEYWDATLANWLQLTTQIVPPALTWNNITGTSALMIPDNGYVANNAGQVVFTLPVLCEFGRELAICGYGSGGWQLTFNSGQNILFGTQVASTTSGSLTSTNQGDQIEILCVVEDTTFVVLRNQGNIIVA